jgi:hypothetical protein
MSPARACTTSGRKKERGKPSIMLRASFALLHFDSRICSYTGVYPHPKRRGSEIPPDLPMTKIMGRGEKTPHTMSAHSLENEAQATTPVIIGVLRSIQVEANAPMLNEWCRVQVRVKQVESQLGIHIIGTYSGAIIG